MNKTQAFKALFRIDVRKLFIFIFAFLPGLIWISQDARMYSMLSFLYILSIWLASKGKWNWLTVINALLLYTHTTAPAYFLGSLAIAFYTHPKNIKYILISYSISFLVYAPWLVYLFNGVGDHWLYPLTSNWLASQTLFAFYAGSLSILGTVAGFILILISLIIGAIKLDKSKYYFIAFAVPFTVLLLVSFLLHNVILYRTLSPLIIPLGLFIGDLLPHLSRFSRWALIILWALVIGIGYKNYDPSLRGGDLGYAAGYIRSHWKTGDVIFYGTGSTAIPFNYYLSDLRHIVNPDPLNSGLGRTGMLKGLGYTLAELDTVEYSRAWVIYPLDPLLTKAQADKLRGLAQGGILITTLYYWQAAPIQVYLIGQ